MFSPGDGQVVAVMKCVGHIVLSCGRGPNCSQTISEGYARQSWSYLSAGNSELCVRISDARPVENIVDEHGPVKANSRFVDHIRAESSIPCQDDILGTAVGRNRNVGGKIVLSLQFITV